MRNSGLPWTLNESYALVRMVNSGMELYQIASLLQRSLIEVEYELDVLTEKEKAL
jgi:hypothetical protein